jgi:hypothetical protein
MAELAGVYGRMRTCAYGPAHAGVISSCDGVKTPTTTALPDFFPAGWRARVSDSGVGGHGVEPAGRPHVGVVEKITTRPSTRAIWYQKNGQIVNVPIGPGCSEIWITLGAPIDGKARQRAPSWSRSRRSE